MGVESRCLALEAAFYAFQEVPEYDRQSINQDRPSGRHKQCGDICSSWSLV